MSFIVENFLKVFRCIVIAADINSLTEPECRRFRNGLTLNKGYILRVFIVPRFQLFPNCFFAFSADIFFGCPRPCITLISVFLFKRTFGAVHIIKIAEDRLGMRCL